MYKLLPNNPLSSQSFVLRLSDNACIPFDPDNTDYQAFLLWCEEGNTVLPADENNNE
jgi:hypothetical protein